MSMCSRNALLLIACAALEAIACAPQDARRDDKAAEGRGLTHAGTAATPRDEAEAVIRAADVFSTGPFGEGAERLPEIDAFAVLLAQPDASRTFQSLVGEATPSGRAYALCGLWLTDRPSYETAAAQCAADEGVVEYYPYGCTGWGIPLNELIESGEPGQADISSGEVPQTLQAYAVDKA